MISEELAAAEEAKRLTDTLEPISPDTPTIVKTLRRAYDQARRAVAQGFSSDTALNEVRNDVVLALNQVIGSLQARTLAQEKIDRAKGLVDTWIGTHGSSFFRSREAAPRASMKGAPPIRMNVRGLRGTLKCSTLFLSCFGTP
jgi:hypothetical protein